MVKKKLHLAAVLAMAVLAMLFGGLAVAPASAVHMAPTAALNDACDNHDWNTCVQPSCVSAGNPGGICWYEGHQFTYRGICIEAWSTANWTNATAESVLNAVQYQWNGNLMRIAVRTAQGACNIAGYADSQIVQFMPYSADDGHCGLSYSEADGYSYNHVTINMHASVAGGFQYASLCRSGTTWNKTWIHEMGHQLGLSHYAEQASVMAFGTTVSSADAGKIVNLYSNNPCGDPFWAGCP